MKYRKKPKEIEAITFDELVEHGKANGANIVDGMPWSFDYQGHPITHETDDDYLIPVRGGTVHFYRSQMLITFSSGELWPLEKDIFRKMYEPA